MNSIWEERSFVKNPDLVVVGAGITGLFTALHARTQDPHRRILVLERGPHPSGASVKNGGFACFGSPSQLMFDLDNEGADVALRRVEERWKGLGELRKTLGDEAIGYEPVGGYELFREGSELHPRGAERLPELNRLLHGIFSRDVFSWADDRLSGLGLHAAHLSWNALEGAVDSGRLMRTLLHRVQGSGVDVRFNTEVDGWHDQANGMELQLRSGGVVKAGQAVIATNGYVRNLVPGSDVVPGRGQMLITSPIPGLKLKGTFHMAEGYYYIRDYDGRVLLGGARHLDFSGETTMEDGTTALIQDNLEQLLRDTIIPGVPFHIEHRWSGVMGFREHGGPTAVEHLSPHVVVAAGLGGIGVAVGIRVAKRAADLVA